MSTFYHTAHLLIRQPEDYDKALIRAAKEKGYKAIGTDCGHWYEPAWEQGPLGLPMLKRVGADALELGMKVSLLTNYQRPGPLALAEHPEWRMEVNDGKRTTEGCPFQEDYLALYIQAMCKVAQVPGIGEIQLNDEMHLTDWGTRWGCYCPVCTALFKEESGQEPPRTPNWSSELWRQWIHWRLRNWVQVHVRMREAIHRVNPDIVCSMQFDPAVCLRGWAPWFSGVDIPAIADALDLIRVDPYHTYHSHTFRPDITFLTENLRYVRGAIAGKPFYCWTQGFTWPEFVRPLTEADGRWTAVLPMAIGVKGNTPFAYNLLQQIPAVAQSHEDSFRFDEYYETTNPVQYIGVVQGSQTKTWHVTEMHDGRAVYDLEYTRPTCYALRRAHVLYEHLWDVRLTPELMAPFQALYLPRVSCLSEAQGAALRSYSGGIVATTDTGCYDHEGRPVTTQALAPEVCIGEWMEFGGLVLTDSDHALSDALAPVCGPVYGRGLRVQAGPEMRVLATFRDVDGKDTGFPAVMVRDGIQRLVYLAFEPQALRSLDGVLRIQLSRGRLSEMLIAASARWAAGEEPAATLAEPAPIGIEYFFGQGDGRWVVTLANYYLDTDDVVLRVRPPSGQRPALVYEALRRQHLQPIQDQEGEYQIRVSLGCDAVKIVSIEWEQCGAASS